MWGKQQIFFYPCAVTIFFGNIWWDLIIENFGLELYVEVATRMMYYTNILLGKNSVWSFVVYSVSVSCCNNDNSGPCGGGGV